MNVNSSSPPTWSGLEGAPRLAAGLLGPSTLRYRHSDGVGAAAARLTKGVDPADGPLLVAAGWLHDIGYSKPVVDTGFHPIDGAESGCTIVDARFAVRIEFLLGPLRAASEVWDLDNLIKPTLDAMEGVFGMRHWRGRPQPADDRVDRIEAIKRHAEAHEVPGATIEVWAIP